MVRDRRASHDAVMTEPSGLGPNGDRAVNDVVRRLRRRPADRVIGGVAGGLADYLNIDPLLVRASFVGLMLFGGAGLVLYVVSWLLIPAGGRDRSIVQDWFAWLSSRLGNRTAILAVLVLALVAFWLAGEAQPCLVYLDEVPYTGQCVDRGYGWFSGFELVGLRNAGLIAIAIIVTGFLVLRWRDGSGRPPGGAGVAASWSAPADATEASGPARTVDSGRGTAPLNDASRLGAPSVPSPWVAPARVPRPWSPLGWYALAAALVAVGVLAIVGNLPGLRVGLGQYFGAGLSVLGLGLVVGAWWGRARLLIAMGVVLLPFAVTAAFINVPLAGGYGEQTFHPQTVGELRPEYRLAVGEIYLDLTGLDSAEPITVSASVGVGRLIVLVRDDARLTVDARVSGGRISLLGGRQVGTGLADRVERAMGTGPLIVLTLESGIGQVLVESAGEG